MKTSLKAILAFLVPYLAAFFLPNVLNADEFVQLMAGIGGIASLTVLVTEYVNTLADLHKNAARILSWVVSIGLTFFSWWVGFGFEGYVVWQLLVSGLAAGLVANGYFTYEVIKTILDAIMPLVDKNNN